MSCRTSVDDEELQNNNESIEWNWKSWTKYSFLRFTIDLIPDLTCSCGSWFPVWTPIWIHPWLLLICSIDLMFFLIGLKFYIHVRSPDSVISNFFPVLIHAFQRWKKNRRTGSVSTTTNRRISDPSRLLDEPSGNSDPSLLTTSERSLSFLDYAKLSNHGKFLDRIVDDIKSLRRIVIVFLLLTPYWFIYIQVKN